MKSFKLPHNHKTLFWPCSHNSKSFERKFVAIIVHMHRNRHHYHNQPKWQ
uniref:Uncharacterized protein n=1 Tax=Anopheles minimus TaxID=112268 RepID=A0A182WMR7_9DIPT